MWMWVRWRRPKRHACLTMVSGNAKGKDRLYILFDPQSVERSTAIVPNCHQLFARYALFEGWERQRQRRQEGLSQSGDQRACSMSRVAQLCEKTLLFSFSVALCFFAGLFFGLLDGSFSFLSAAVYHVDGRRGQDGKGNPLNSFSLFTEDSLLTQSMSNTYFAVASLSLRQRERGW